MREIAETAPYMHNGALLSLEDAVDFYDRGGGDNPSKDPLLKPLHLTDAEKAALVAFLESLSGDVIEIKTPDLPKKVDGTF